MNSLFVSIQYFAPLWSADPWWPMVLTQVVWGMKIIEKHDDATNFFRLWTWPRRCLAGELFFGDSLKIGEIPLCLTYQRQNPQKNDRWPKLFTSYLVKELGHVHPCAMQLPCIKGGQWCKKKKLFGWIFVGFWYYKVSLNLGHGLCWCSNNMLI